MSLYVVDLAELKAVIGSNDAELRDRVLTELSEYHDPQVLRAIIAGGPFDENKAVDYFGALESICEVIGGKGVYNCEFRFGNDDFDHTELVDRLNDGRILPQSDGAGWGYWSFEDCTSTLADFEEEGYPDEEDEDPYLPIWCLREASDTQKDLVGFWAG